MRSRPMASQEIISRLGAATIQKMDGTNSDNSLTYIEKATISTRIQTSNLITS